jgi:hypothetical protein
VRYFTIKTLADSGRGDYCYSNHTPDGIGTRWYRLANGVPFGDEYPETADDVRLRLGDDYPGLKLPSFIGNTARMLVVQEKAAATILSHNVGQVERLPFVLIDHKGRVHSRDYVFLNPLEQIECLNLEASEVRKSRKGEIKDVIKMVLDKNKERDFLDLFRLAEKPNVYLFSERVVSALEAGGSTNFVFDAVESR